MKTIIKVVSVIILMCTYVNGQEYKFGKVSIDELQATSDNFFPDANAVVLYREVKSYIGKSLRVFERIKIYNEEGFESATVRIPYNYAKNVKAVTYNLENGQIVETKIDRDFVFTDEEIKGVKIKKFTFPKVKPGSVLELTYNTERWITSDIAIQYDIPIKKLRVEVTNYSTGRFKMVQNPRAYLPVNRIIEGKTTIISHKNIPALEEENYVYDMDLYRSKLEFKWGGWANSLKINTWESLVEILFEIDDFASNIKPKNFYEDEVKLITRGESNKMNMVKAVYDYLKSNMKWNRNYGYFPEEGIRKAFKEKEGNVGDINMLLISMLRSLKIETHPILVSTRSNGIPVVAGASVYNYIIAGVKINNEFIYLDAANTKSTFDYLPESLLNWNGRLIREDGSSDIVDLTIPKYSEAITMANVTIDEDLLIEGQAREKRTGYYAIRLKSKLKDLGESDKEDLISFDYKDMEVSDLETEPDEKRNLYLLNYNFEIEDAIDEIEGKLYLSPLLFLSIQENPFTKDERIYPIDFGFPKRHQYLMNIKVPEGYTVSHVPESISILLPDGLGSYTYRINLSGNMLQIQSRYNINTTMMLQDMYSHLKEFFKMRMDKENEQVIIEKAM